MESEHGDQRWRSQSHPFCDMSDVECYYCGKKGHIQTRCPQFRDDVKMLSKMFLRKDDGGSNTNVVSDDDNSVMYLATSEDVASQSGWWTMMPQCIFFRIKPCSTP